MNPFATAPILSVAYTGTPDDPVQTAIKVDSSFWKVTGGGVKTPIELAEDGWTLSPAKPINDLIQSAREGVINALYLMDPDLWTAVTYEVPPGATIPKGEPYIVFADGDTRFMLNGHINPIHPYNRKPHHTYRTISPIEPPQRKWADAIAVQAHTAQDPTRRVYAWATHDGRECWEATGRYGIYDIEELIDPVPLYPKETP